jgi:hypothetical protein
MQGGNLVLDVSLSWSFGREGRREARRRHRKTPRMWTSRPALIVLGHGLEARREQT